MIGNRSGLSLMNAILNGFQDDVRRLQVALSKAWAEKQGNQ
jgi:hypothetical protein